MKKVLFSLLLLLTACTAGKDTRYKDTEMLERPPSSPLKKVELDTSSIPRAKITTGLGDDVSLTTPTQLQIKQPYSDAWHSLGLALKQCGIEITDREHDKGLYYVLYAPDALLFGKASNPAIYLLTVTKDGAATKVNVTVGDDNEQNSAPEHKQRISSKAELALHGKEGKEELMQTLYKMLHEDLKEE
jgi:uncharacterized lipoprotein